MSHHLRKDNNCLNCGNTVEERFCTHCGQENLEPKESFSHLFRHFFEDLTHYDSKFFNTIKDLLTKPGFLTKEYLAGRRASYLHPIRMYVFVSFLYFLAVFSFSNSELKAEEELSKHYALETKKKISENLDSMLLEKPDDSIRSATIHEVIARNKLDSVPDNLAFVIISGLSFGDLEHFEKQQQALPENKREKSIRAWLYHRWYKNIEEHGEATIYLVIAKTTHIIPKMMFILLPLFALLLKLFFDRKKYLYADHAIFSLHIHTAIFLFFLFSTLIEKLTPSLYHAVEGAGAFIIFGYLILAIRNTYSQTVFRSIYKSVLLTLLYGIFIIFGLLTTALGTLL